MTTHLTILRISGIIGYYASCLSVSHETRIYLGAVMISISGAFITAALVFAQGARTQTEQIPIRIRIVQDGADSVGTLYGLRLQARFRRAPNYLLVNDNAEPFDITVEISSRSEDPPPQNRSSILSVMAYKARERTLLFQVVLPLSANRIELGADDMSNYLQQRVNQAGWFLK